MDVSNIKITGVPASAPCSMIFRVRRDLAVVSIISVCILLSSFPSFGQGEDCEVASQCYAIAFNATVLAETLREQGEMVSWDDVKALEKAMYRFMGAVIADCNYSDFSKEIEDYTERDFDRIIMGSRNTSFFSILLQYKLEAQSCMNLYSP